MIWVIGSQGLLGSAVVSHLAEKKMLVTGSDKEIDCTKYEVLENFINSKETEVYYSSHRNQKDPTEGKIDWIINCSSLLSYEDCGMSPEEAEKANEKAALNVARVSRSHGAKLIHVSSPFAFGNTQSEEIVTQTMTQYYVIKTSKLFGKKEGSYIPSLISKINSSEDVSEINDQYENFTSVNEIASLISLIIDKSKNATSFFGKKSALSYGVYNFTNQGKATPFEFANFVLEEAKKKKLVKGNGKVVEAVENVEASGESKSSEISEEILLDSTLIEKSLRVKIPNWKDAVKKLI